MMIESQKEHTFVILKTVRRRLFIFFINELKLKNGLRDASIVVITRARQSTS